MFETKVIFTYDDVAKKWTATVTGVENENEALQAFTAVLITMNMVEAKLQDKALVSKTLDNDNEFMVIPAVQIKENI